MMYRWAALRNNVYRTENREAYGVAHVLVDFSKSVQLYKIFPWILSRHPCCHLFPVREHLLLAPSMRVSQLTLSSASNHMYWWSGVQASTNVAVVQRCSGAAVHK